MREIKNVDYKKEYYGSINSQPIYLYTLKAGFITLKVINYGATVTAIEMPDKNRNTHNIVAGFSSLEEYCKPHPYFGATIGRFTNRISRGQFSLDGKKYQLSTNDSPNHLHGGEQGFHKKTWQPEDPILSDNHCSLSLSTSSNDMEEGYPGNLKTTVTYTVNSLNEIEIKYQAITDKATPISLTNHSYFNLSGFITSTVKDHTLKIYSTFYTEKNKNNTSTGKLLKCADTPHDFRQAKKIGKNIDQLYLDQGYDHNHVIDNFGQGIQPVAKLADEYSGRVLEVHSDMPGVHIYTANFWDGSLSGTQGVPYEKNGAIALETQRFPDSPNHSSFPDSILRPGDNFTSRTIYKLSIHKGN